MSRKSFKSEADKSTVSQSERFIEAARQLGADEDETAFKAKLAVIARQRPKADDLKPPAASKVPE